MAITYNDLLEADFSALDATGLAWKELGEALDADLAELEALTSGEDSKLGVDNWEGVAAEAGRERLREVVIELDDRAAAARRVGIAAADAVEAFNSCKTDLDEVIAELDRERAILTDTGSVVPDTTKGTDNITYAQNMSSRIQSILEAATEADEALKAAVGVYAETLGTEERGELAARAEGPAEKLQELIDGGSSPERVNQWWNDLDETERLALLETNPELIAALDGVPTDFRDTANRGLLERELDRFDPALDTEISELEDQLAQLEANGERYDYRGDLGVPYETGEYAEIAEQLESLTAERDRRDAMMGLQDSITGQAETGQDYFLLGYDSAEDGKAIVSVGNPDSADNTAVYVPGTGSDLEGFGGAVDRAETMASDAQWYGGGQETAVVAWVDYDAPDDPVRDAGFLKYAEEAGPALSRFTGGLEATHSDGGAHTTMVGHSYGTTVVGHTASEQGIEADKVIAVASPGMDTISADELGVGAENVYATTAQGDDIRMTTDGISKGGYILGAINGDPRMPDAEEDGYYAWHGGTNPVHDDYGATDFASDPTDHHGNRTDDGSKIHSGYWGKENIARENMAYLITDQADRVIAAEGHES